MNFARKFVAVFLCLFMASPIFAEEKKATAPADGYRFFKLGVRPVDSSGNVNWEKECVVTLSEPSPRVRLQFKKTDGTIGVSNFGNIHDGVEVIVDSKSGKALRIRLCGNGIAEPSTWVPTGEKKCQPAVPAESGTAKVVVADVPPTELTSAPLPAKPLKIEVPVVSEPPPIKAGMDKKKPSKTWLYVLGGMVVGAGIYALASSGKKSSSSNTGGPAPDPRN